MRTASLALVALLSSCSARTPRSGAAGPVAVLPTVLMVGAGRGCAPGQPDISQWVAPALDEAECKLRSLGLVDVRRVEASSGAVLEELQRERREPLIVLFSGHGGLLEATAKGPGWVSRCSESGARCVSMACVGAPLSFDALVQAVSPSTPWAFFLLDACTSAHVDVRFARTRVSVVSISPFPVDGDLALLTRGIATLENIHLDRDCDGVVTDIEFFLALNQRFAERCALSQLPECAVRGAFMANPKLRKQGSEPLALFRSPTRSVCQPRSVPHHQGVEKVDARAYVTYEKLPAGAALLWDGHAIPASSLQVTPCEHEVGQCFREYP